MGMVPRGPTRAGPSRLGGRVLVAGWLVATWTGLTQVSMEARSKTSPRGGGWLVVLRVRKGGLSELHERLEEAKTS